MKRFFYILMSLWTLLAMASCNKGVIPEAQGGGEDDDPYAKEDKVTLALKGVSAKYSDVTFSQEWTDEDAIGVYVNSEGAPVRFKIGEISADGASFSAKIKSADNYSAVYPYSRDYVIKNGEFSVVLPSAPTASPSSAALVSFAEVNDGKANFSRIFPLLEFSLKANGVAAVKITSADEGSPLAGTALVKTSNLSLSCKESTGSASVELKTAFENETAYYVAVFPGKYSLSLSFTNSEGKTVTRNLENKVETTGGKVTSLGSFEIADSEWAGGKDEPDTPDIPSGPKDYVLNGKAEVEAFAAAKADTLETVNNLTIKGHDVTHKIARKVMERVGTVNGTFTLEGVGTETSSDWFDTEGFLNGMTLKGGIVFRDIVNVVNPSALKYYEKINGDLVIENCPSFVLADWSRIFETITEVTGNLVIKGCRPSSFDGNFLKALKKVGGNFDFEDNSSIWSFKNKGDVALEYIGGDLILSDNGSLWSLLGFDKLTHIGGNVVVYNNNQKFPLTNSNVDGEDCIGYCLLKDYQVSGVISTTATVKIGSDSAPIDFSALKGCSAGEDPLPSEPQDYVLVGHDAVKAFNDAASSTTETVRNLTVSGSDVTENDVRDLDNRVSRITGTLTLENLGTSDSWISTDQVFENISVEGSIIFKNIPAHINPNGFEKLTKINGDLQVINCPGLRCSGGWMPFKSVTEITGNLLISSQSEFGSAFLNKLEKVGGDFTLEKCTTSCWDWKTETLTYIGGSLNIIDCTLWENFYGFHLLKTLGGDVNIYKSEGYAQDSNGNDKWLPGTDWDLTNKKVGLVLFSVLKKKGIFTGKFTSYLWRAEDRSGTFWYDITWDEYMNKADEIIAAEGK